MQSPVVVASTWSASRAELLAAYLRGLGFDSYMKSNFDRTTYGGEFGGASVFVEADQLLEAEFELVLLEKGTPADLGADHDTAFGFDTDADELERRPNRSWVRVAAYVTLAAMSLGVIVPSVSVVWSRVLG